MQPDLIVRRANLPDGRSGIDIAVKDGRIVEIGHAIVAEPGKEIDATGRQRPAAGSLDCSYSSRSRSRRRAGSVAAVIAATASAPGRA